MRNNYIADQERLEARLNAYESSHGELPGLLSSASRVTFIDQLIDSEQRVLYTERLLSRGVDPASANPLDLGFDPVRAAIHHSSNGNYDEAVWLVFMFVHFGKHKTAGWRYIRDIYGQLQGAETWNWEAVSSDVTAFRFWLDEHQVQLKQEPGPRGFGNHRKYESLDAWSAAGTGAVVESYVDWVLSSDSDHLSHFSTFEGSPEARFDQLYRSMREVHRFGRTARFDYLTMLAKLRLLDVRPPHGYIKAATGPLRGAGLLFHGDRFAGLPKKMEDSSAVLAAELGVGHNVFEDAICNWQKSPDNYIRFSG